jgi:hypothetical protein
MLSFVRCLRPAAKASLAAVLLCALIALLPLNEAFSGQPTTAAAASGEPLDARTLEDLKSMYRRLIDAENRHDLKGVSSFCGHRPRCSSSRRLRQLPKAIGPGSGAPTS